MPTPNEPQPEDRSHVVDNLKTLSSELEKISKGLKATLSNLPGGAVLSHGSATDQLVRQKVMVDGFKKQADDLIKNKHVVGFNRDNLIDEINGEIEKLHGSESAAGLRKSLEAAIQKIKPEASSPRHGG